MFDSSQHLETLLTATSPTPHAIRGVSLALVALTALANLTDNCKAILVLLRRGDPSLLKLAVPSRTGLALAVFIGIFRYHQRSASIENKDAGPSQNNNAVRDALPPGVVSASALAAAVSTLCVAPENRPALVSLLSANAASKLFGDLIVKKPQLSFLQPLELLVFMAAGGWIFSSGFFYPESYERSHMKTILKSVALQQSVANELQTKYRQGLNPNPCCFRHEGLTCGEFARSNFFLRVVTISLRLYAPVHLTTWLLALRHRKVRSKPIISQFEGFAAKLCRSASYLTGYVYFGWMLCCLLGKLGDRSHSCRKLQFFLSGAIPSLAIFAESPSRRRSIGLILTSYAFVSAGNVATRRVELLKPGVSPVRGLMEAGCVATAVSVVIPQFLENNHIVRRMLLGYQEARAMQDARKQHQEVSTVV